MKVLSTRLPTLIKTMVLIGELVITLKLIKSVNEAVNVFAI